MLLSSKQSHLGFSIIELMVALVIGLFLLSGVLTVYLSNKQTYVSTQSLARVQENLRFSMDMLTKDARMAGYMPCRYQANLSNILTDNGNTWWQPFFDSGLVGFEGGVSTFPATIAADVEPGTDAIAIFKGGSFEASILVHDTAAEEIILKDTAPINELSKGEIAIICDSHQATLFQISDVDTSDFEIEYSDSAADISPGNCTAGLGSTGNVVCGDANSGETHFFGEGAQLVSYAPVIYYIAESDTPGVFALKRNHLVARDISGVETANMEAEELLQGVESMQIRYGVDTDASPDGIANQFFDANLVATSDWPNVVSIQVGILMASGDEIRTNIDTNTYNLAGELIAPSGPGLTHPQDQQMRYVVNSTVSLRNR